MSKGNNIDSYSKWQIGLGCKKNLCPVVPGIGKYFILANELPKFVRMRIMNLIINHPQASGFGWDLGNEARRAPDK